MHYGNDAAIDEEVFFGSRTENIIHKKILLPGTCQTARILNTMEIPNPRRKPIKTCRGVWPTNSLSFS